MKDSPDDRLKTAAARAAAAALMLAVAVAAAAAQGRPPDAGAPGRVNPKDSTQSQTNREARLRSAEIGASSEQVNHQRLAAAIEQTKNDFKRIQLLRNDLIDLLVSKRALDYKQLSEQADEINKRANRLKSFLMKSPEKEDGGEKKGEATPAVYDEPAMRSALVKLCNTIHSFTGNPMFKNPAVVDAQQPARAGSDLLAIIELSENVKHNAERMTKPDR